MEFLPPAPTQRALRTLEWIDRCENLVVCGPSGLGVRRHTRRHRDPVVPAGRNDQNVPIYAIEDPDASLTPGSAWRAFSSLAALHPEVEYIRLEDRSHDVVAFADFRNDDFLHVDRATGDSQVLNPPVTETPPWSTALGALHEMAGAEAVAIRYGQR